MAAHTLRIGTFAMAAGFVVACARAPEENLGKRSDRIVAADHPEAVIIDMVDGAGTTSGCSGALLSSHVVLTAGHCVTGDIRTWTVIAPYAGGDSAAMRTTSTGVTFDYRTSPDGKVLPNLHDVGLLFLAEGIDLPHYPPLLPAALQNGANVVIVGRTNEGASSRDELFVSEESAVRSDDAKFPLDYVSSRQLDHGDSGGPVKWRQGSCYWVAGVNSGTKVATSQYARTDLLYGWIQAFMNEHGDHVAACDAAPPAVPPEAPPAPPMSATPGNSPPDPQASLGTPCSGDGTCNGGVAGRQLVCSTATSDVGTCVRGCHSNDDCPLGTSCDRTAAPHWACR